MFERSSVHTLRMIYLWQNTLVYKSLFIRGNIGILCSHCKRYTALLKCLPSKIVHSKTSFEKNCFSAWASTLNMGLINKVDVVCLSPVGYGV